MALGVSAGISPPCVDRVVCHGGGRRIPTGSVLDPSRYPVDYLHFSFFGTMDSIAAGCLLAIYEPKIHDRCKWMAEYPAIAIAVPVTAWALEASFWGSMSVLWGAVRC